MSDLVDRLREAITLYSACLENADKHMNLLSSSADEIERLHSELAEAKRIHEICLSDNERLTRFLRNADKGLIELATLKDELAVVKKDLEMALEVQEEYERLAVDYREALGALKSQPAHSDPVAVHHGYGHYTALKPLGVDQLLYATSQPSAEVNRDELIETCARICDPGFIGEYPLGSGKDDRYDIARADMAAKIRALSAMKKG